MKTVISKFAAGALVVGATVSLCACSNTFHGIGQDIEKAGEKIQGATNK